MKDEEAILRDFAGLRSHYEATIRKLQMRVDGTALEEIRLHGIIDQLKNDHSESFLRAALTSATERVSELKAERKNDEHDLAHAKQWKEDARHCIEKRDERILEFAQERDDLFKCLMAYIRLKKAPTFKGVFTVLHHFQRKRHG